MDSVTEKLWLSSRIDQSAYLAGGDLAIFFWETRRIVGNFQPTSGFTVHLWFYQKLST